jgi:hypothetical protein
LPWESSFLYGWHGTNTRALRGFGGVLKRIVVVGAMVVAMFGAIAVFLWNVEEYSEGGLRSAALGRDIQLSGVSIAPGNSKTPQGILADKIIDDSRSEYGFVYRDFEFLEGADQKTFSIDFKPVNTAIIQFILAYLTPDGNSRMYYAMVDARTGLIIGQRGTVAIAPMSDGWHRVTITGLPPENCRTVRVQIYPAHGDEQQTGSILIAHGQVS